MWWKNDLMKKKTKEKNEQIENETEPHQMKMCKSC